MKIEVKFVPSEKYTAVYFNNVRVGLYREDDGRLVDYKVWNFTPEEPFTMGWSNREFINEARMQENLLQYVGVYGAENQHVLNLMYNIESGLPNDILQGSGSFKHLKNIYHLKSEMKRLEEKI